MIHLMHAFVGCVCALQFLGIIILPKNCDGEKLWKTTETYAGSYKAWQQITSLVFYYYNCFRYLKTWVTTEVTTLWRDMEKFGQLFGLQLLLWWDDGVGLQ